MNNPKNNKGIIVLLIVIIIILSSLCVLFATNTISFKSNNTINDTSNNDDVNDKVDVNLSINNVIISGLMLTDGDQEIMINDPKIIEKVKDETLSSNVIDNFRIE